MPLLEIEYQNINEGEWLSQTEAFLNGTPSNYIIFKILPNLGATHGEINIYNWRNSIIIEPNVPVIEVKASEVNDKGEKAYPSLFPVYGKVSKAAVVRYLKSSTKPKKIVCTPEAYESKVKPAIEETKGFDLFKDFFMLLDESDKLTTESDYRDKIILPIDDFFNFDAKAMISATALTPSDPRFVQHGFKILKIMPMWDYKKNINLIGTNNTMGAFEQLLMQDKDESYFVFINSANLIYAIIEALQIKSESKVYCAVKSKKKLSKMGLDEVSDALGDYKKYNFLTSRFFSAVDLKVPYEPNVVVLSNVFKAPHSIVDPYTDVVQIVGRLRNGVKKSVHITNYNATIKYEDQEKALQDIYDSYDEYSKIAGRLGEVETDGGKTTLTQATQRTDISKFVNDKHELLPYMVDNHLYGQQIRSYYRGYGYLKSAYDNVDYWKVNYKFQSFTVSDSQLYELEFAKGRSNIIESVATILHSYDKQPESGEIVFRLGDTRAEVEREHPDIVQDYKAIGGYDRMKDMKFNQAMITREIKRLSKVSELNNPEMAKQIQSWYKVGDNPLATAVQERFHDTYLEFGISKPARGTHILRHYDAELTTDKHNQKIYKINGLKK
jgi:hypothetical protein